MVLVHVWTTGNDKIQTQVFHFYYKRWHMILASLEPFDIIQDEPILQPFYSHTFKYKNIFYMEREY